MDVKTTKQQIKKAISSLPIPRALREDAEQEGFIAYLEGKDIKAHVRKWLRGELDFRDKLGASTAKDNAIVKGEGLDDPSNTKRRIDKAI